MKLNDFKKFNLPEKPGVYFFLGPTKLGEGGYKGGGLLYVGKATSLKDRVRSYFSKDLIETRGPLILEMVFRANSIKWQETDSVLEALILEASLIKKYQPYFNTKEKDDKSFNYVCITKEELPKVLIVRGKELQKQGNFSHFTLKGSDATKNFPVSFTNIYGPFPNGSQLKTALELVRKIFPFLDEKSKVKGTYEFYRQIKLAPEQKEILLKNIKNIKLFFEGKKQSILKSLQKEMKLYAKQKEFEKAGEIKRQIFALGHINDVALIKDDSVSKTFSRDILLHSTTARKSLANPTLRIEAYDIAHMSGQNMVGVMVVSKNGELEKNEYKKFIIRSQQNANDTGALREVLERRFKHTEWHTPSLIVVDGNIMQVNVAKKVLQDFKLNIPVVGVVKDDKHKAREILGDTTIAQKYKKEIIALNAESHRFAINFHKQKRNKNFLK